MAVTDASRCGSGHGASRRFLTCRIDELRSFSGTPRLGPRRRQNDRVVREFHALTIARTRIYRCPVQDRQRSRVALDPALVCGFTQTTCCIERQGALVPDMMAVCAADTRSEETPWLNHASRPRSHAPRHVRHAGDE